MATFSCAVSAVPPKSETFSQFDSAMDCDTATTTLTPNMAMEPQPTSAVCASFTASSLQSDATTPQPNLNARISCLTENLTTAYASISFAQHEALADELIKTTLEYIDANFEQQKEQLNDLREVIDSERSLIELNDSINALNLEMLAIEAQVTEMELAMQKFEAGVNHIELMPVCITPCNLHFPQLRGNCQQKDERQCMSKLNINVVKSLNEIRCLLDEAAVIQQCLGISPDFECAVSKIIDMHLIAFKHCETCLETIMTDTVYVSGTLDLAEQQTCCNQSNSTDC